jgi:DNA-binding IclR family transcriptional regulator
MKRVTSRRRDALGKAFQVVRWIVDATDDGLHKEWGVRELGEALKFPPASVHRLLAALLEHGLVRRNPDSGQYQIGMEFYRLAMKLSSRSGIRNASLPIMQELVAQCDENALLALYDSSRMEIMFVAAVDSNHPLRYVQSLNEWLPVYTGASGLAVMAFLPKPERLDVIKRTGLAPVTRNTIANPALLEEELAKVRLRGYALSRGQRNLGTVGLAAPIWNPDGRVIGSLILAMPEQRFNNRLEPRLARHVIQHADQITERIGGRKPSAKS